MNLYLAAILTTLIFSVLSAAQSCTPASLNFNIAAQELRVRGIDTTRGRMSIRVRCTRENASEAFEEMLERTYEAILRCTGANSDPRQKSAAVIAEETQAFVETAMRIVNDRIDSWSRRPKARLFTLPQYLLSKSSQFLVIDPTEVYINRVIAKRIPENEYAAFVELSSRRTRMFIKSQNYLSDEFYNIN